MQNYNTAHSLIPKTKHKATHRESDKTEYTQEDTLNSRRYKNRKKSEQAVLHCKPNLKVTDTL